MKQSRTHVTFLIDRSGSMANQTEGVRAGFASFIKDQAEVEGKCRLTAIQFDSDDPCEVLARDVPVQKLDAAKTLERFYARNATPLYDATAKAIALTTQILEERKSAAKAADHVIFVVFTDGAENASREYDYTTLTALVKEREAAGWTFVYLGANHDAYAQSATFAVSSGSTQSYAGTNAGTQSAYSSLSAATTNMRKGMSMAGSGGTANLDFFAETGKAAEAELTTPPARKPAAPRARTPRKATTPAPADKK